MSQYLLTLTVVSIIVGTVKSNEFESMVISEIEKLRLELHDVKAENKELRASIEIERNRNCENKREINDVKTENKELRASFEIERIRNDEDGIQVRLLQSFYNEMQSQIDELTKTNHALHERLYTLEQYDGGENQLMDFANAAGYISHRKQTTVGNDNSEHDEDTEETYSDKPMLSRADLGNGYSPQDGIFDVPVTGTYVFTFTVYCQPRHYVHAELVVDGQVKNSLLADAQEVGDGHTGTATIVVHVNAGNHVFVRRSDSAGGGECNVLSGKYSAVTTFSGWLL